LLDRIDIHVEVPALSYDELKGKQKGMSSEQMQEAVLSAREIQKQRFSDKVSPANANMTEKEIEKYCKLDEASEMLLKNAMDELGLSARGHARILKVSRTIADLYNAKNIEAEHLAEAIQYRALDRRDSY
jgi:magnesium chelatase family protein